MSFSAAGELLSGDPAVMESELVYAVEKPDRQFELLRPSEFGLRLTQAPAGK